MDKNKWLRLTKDYLNNYNNTKLIKDNENITNIDEHKIQDKSIIYSNDDISNKNEFNSKQNFFKKNKLSLILILTTSILAVIFFFFFLYYIIKNKNKVDNNNIINTDNISILIYKTNKINEKIHLLSDKIEIDNKPGFFSRERSKFNLIDLEKNISINTSDYIFNEIGQHKIKFEFKENISDYSFMFYDCKNLIVILGKFQVNGATNFKGMFKGCSELIFIDNMEEWDVSKGIDFSYMFAKCSSLISIKDLSLWNTSNGLYFNNMFSNCSSLVNANSISKWNVNKGIDFSEIFYGCSNLKYSNDLSLWKTNINSKFKGMFYDCDKLEIVEELINKYGNNIVNYGILLYKTSACNETAQIISNCRIIYSMFHSESYPGDSYTYYSKDFLNNETFYNIELIYGDKIIDLKKVNASLSDDCPYDTDKTFENPGIHEIKIKIKNKISSLNYLFADCTFLIGIIGYLNVSNAKNFGYLFMNCFSLSNINALKDWNVSNGIYFNYMFYNCYSLKNINSLSNWNVSNGKEFDYMFNNCSSLNNINALSNWNISNGKEFDYMFYNCYSLNNIDALSNWNVSNGNHFNYMFYNCSSLNNINGVYKWDVSKGTEFKYMFYNCIKLKNVDGIILWKKEKNVNNYGLSCLFNNNTNLDNKDKLIDKFGKNCICY